MKSLYDSIKDGNQPEFIIDGIVFDEPDSHGIITEKKDYGMSKLPGTKYLYRIDKPRGEISKGNQYHIHVYAKNKTEIFAVKHGWLWP